MACEHKRFIWIPTGPNERGWKCDSCDFKPGEPPGYDPQRDRSDIREKVHAVLFQLHLTDIVYVSNSDHGEWLAAEVATRCVREDTFDQLSIVRFLCEALDDDGKHSAHWRDQAQGILAGNDPRERCACGALATVFVVGGEKTCSEHARFL